MLTAIRQSREQAYGIDCALRDPFGNNIRIGQLASERPQESVG